MGYSYRKRDRNIQKSEASITENAELRPGSIRAPANFIPGKITKMFIPFHSFPVPICKYQCAKLPVIMIDRRYLLTMKNLVTYAYHPLVTCHYVSYSRVI